jgi:hypothetical protein
MRLWRMRISVDLLRNPLPNERSVAHSSNVARRAAETRPDILTVSVG